MSSFVISKPEFVKAAGLMYGIESARNHSHRYFLENVRKEFVRAYELNVASVNEQYGDDSLTDGLDYDSTFEEYKEKGERIYIASVLSNSNGFKWLRPRLMNFFSFVLYQIENEEMHKEVSSFFMTCISNLFKEDTSSVDGWWGEIEC